MSKKVAIISISTLIILVGLVVGGLFVFQGKNIPLLNRVVTIPFVEKASAQVMDQMISKMKSIESGYMAFDLSLDVKAPENNTNTNSQDKALGLGLTNSDIGLNLGVGFSFQTGEEVLQQKGKFDLEGGIEYAGMNYDLGLESIYLPDKIYFQATKIPAIPFFDLSGLANQWYYEDYEDLSDDVPYVNSMEELTLTVNDFKNNLDKHNFIEVKKRLPNEKIGETDCLHYLVKIDSQKLKLFFMESNQDLLNNLNENVNSAEVKKELEEAINEYTEMINKKGIEVWVGQEDMILRKISLDLRYDEKESLANYQYADVKMSLTLSNVNQPIKVTIPDNAKPLEELEEAVNDITGIFNTNTSMPSTNLNLNLNTNSSSNQNTNISVNNNTNTSLNSNININTNFSLDNDSDSDGLTDMEEIIYGTDKDDPDTDGDGYEDGAEVEAGYDPSGAGKLDSDADGLLDIEEEKYGTDINNKDTDGDGYLDGEEVLGGYNPNGEGKLLNIIN